MGKIKLSFSLFFAIFLIGVLSTAASAASPYYLKSVPNSSGGFDVSWHGKDATTQPTGTQFTVKLMSKDGSGNYAVQVGSSVSGNLTDIKDWNQTFTGSVTIPPAGIVKNTTYQVELYLGDGTTGSPVETAFTVFSDSHNTKLPSVPDAGIDVKGSGLVNANETGLNNKKKTRPGDHVHGFYTNNTNSCASCHQTHTAANGEYLLFKDGVYSTCSACHDGTTGAYNSFAPASDKTTASISGTFDVSASGHNGSLHQSDGSLQITAAPGGSSDTKSATGAATWGQEFDCASCHAAHGSGTGNNLNLDPMGWGKIPYASTDNDTKHGKLFTNATIYTAVPPTQTTPYILVKKQLAAADISTDKTKTGYLYNRAGVTAGQWVIQTYRWVGEKSKYQPDFSLWLRDKGRASGVFSTADTLFKDAGSNDITNTLNVVWKDGFVYGDQAVIDSIASAQFAIGIDVETTSDIASLFDNTNANFVVDSGTEMSKYCASCHVDYLSATRTDTTGVYTQAHRHQTGSDKLTCVRCHYAHGSEATIMKDANDSTYFSGPHAGDLNYFVDPNPSSAIKRYTGMSVCYACHGSGEEFMGNANNVDHPITGQPGAVRGK